MDWGFQLSTIEKVAVLACVAQAGYHSVSEYQWLRGDTLLQNESHPIIYVEVCGPYKCVVKSGDDKKEYLFTVEGIISCYNIGYNAWRDRALLIVLFLITLIFLYSYWR